MQRIEKVVRYFKLHGSISWVSDGKHTPSNIYGIEEMPIELIKRKAENDDFDYGNLMIYPTAVKKSYTLDLPYSELFRHFSYCISQPQSVLFTVGYSFYDEHFNDIIYQALSNPTFTLIIIDFNGCESVATDGLNEYISTLLLRMRSYIDDVRLSEPLMLDKQEDINDALIQFLAFVFGDYCTIYDKQEYKDSEFQTYYEGSTKDREEKVRNQITIIDMSLLPFQVLETITGLIGRMILEFLSRFEKSKRGSIPVVIVLEEAQNYIPEFDRKDREPISKKVFERIAREGRKYGLSLVVSSQRPSELSKTVLSQCNSFIVHRIQNPDDQSYIRKLVSTANSEILNQLPTLPQQHVIIMGDCVRTPIVARMNDAKPRPNSSNPEFIRNWLRDEVADYDGVVKKWTEQKSGETDEVERQP